MKKACTAIKWLKWTLFLQEIAHNYWKSEWKVLVGLFQYCKLNFIQRFRIKSIDHQRNPHSVLTLCLQFGLLPHVMLTLTLYDVPVTKVEKRKISRIDGSVGDGVSVISCRPPKVSATGMEIIPHAHCPSPATLMRMLVGCQTSLWSKTLLPNCLPAILLQLIHSGQSDASGTFQDMLSRSVPTEEQQVGWHSAFRWTCMSAFPSWVIHNECSLMYFEDTGNRIILLTSCIEIHLWLRIT